MATEKSDLLMEAGLYDAVTSRHFAPAKGCLVQ